uniref:Uncharacterized protein n=1 Tax=Nelumbo nucifera TaxID=4432 RepID=A0A822ZQF2_NELNU|nr:TPA_asm: hypothetical protein HUJ06_003971 [Nelumbo nucifera]
MTLFLDDAFIVVVLELLLPTSFPKLEYGGAIIVVSFSFGVEAGNGIALWLADYFFVVIGSIAEALSYDYSYLAESHRPQYEGGIIANPEFNHGLRGWSIFGSAKIEQGVLEGGNSFIVTHSRKQLHDSI